MASTHIMSCLMKPAASSTTPYTTCLGVRRGLQGHDARIAYTEVGAVINAQSIVYNATYGARYHGAGVGVKISAVLGTADVVL